MISGILTLVVSVISGILTFVVSVISGILTFVVSIISGITALVTSAQPLLPTAPTGWRPGGSGSFPLALIQPRCT